MKRKGHASALSQPGWLPLRAYFAILLVLVASAAGGTIVYVSAQADADVRAVAHKDAAFAAKTAAGQLATFAQTMRDTVKNLAANPQIGKVLTNPDGCTLTFTGLAGPGSGHLDIVRSDGSVACSSLPIKAGQSYAGSSWLTAKSPLFLAPVADPRGSGPAMVSVAPIAGGAVVVFSDLAKLAPRLASLYGGGRAVEFLITNEEGTVVSRSLQPRRWIGTALRGTPLLQSSGIERTDLDGVDRYYASMSVPALGWHFYAGEEKSAALALRNRHKQRQLMIVLAGLLAFLLGAALIHYNVVQPIRRLGSAVRSENGLPAKVDVSARWPREVAVLGNDVNVLISSIEHELAERKRTEEKLAQAHKMEAVGQLAGGIAHDFNNLLMAISGFGELAREKSADPDVVEDLDELLHASGRAAELTHQLLAFSRKQILQVRPLDLNEVVRDTERLLGRLIGEDVEVITSLDPDLGAVVADAGQLSQIIINLAVNARDAMPTGGTLTIETANIDIDPAMSQSLAEAEPGPYVRLSVTDTGVGIDEEAMEHIFEPFYTTKEVGEGSGLGLSTVFGTVKQLGGHISLYSEPGAGAVFNIYLPRSGTPAPVLAAQQQALEQVGTEEILLVEDEEPVRQVISQMLERQGYIVTSAGHPEEALLLAGEKPFDLLITDVVMPGLNGHELAGQLAEKSPAMKVMYVSGYTSTAIVQRGVLDSEVAFLQKPFALGALAAKVREVLDAS